MKAESFTDRMVFSRNLHFLRQFKKKLNKNYSVFIVKANKRTSQLFLSDTANT